MTEKLKVDWWCVAPEDTCPIKNENDEIIYYRQLSEALEEYNQISKLKKKINNLEVAVEVLTKYNQKLEKRQQSSNEECLKYIEELTKENEQLYELIDFANTLFAFKTSESCQKEWEERLKELEE